MPAARLGPLSGLRTALVPLVAGAARGAEAAHEALISQCWVRVAVQEMGARG